jgi:hypothetical protein
MTDFQGRKERDEFHRALGEFVAQFAAVENNMHLALRTCAGVSAQMAATLFSGTRTEAAAQNIRRISEAEKWPEPRAKEAEYIFKQLSEINRVRNDLLHYGAKPISENKLVPPLGADEWIVSNELVAHTPERVRKTKITPAILGLLTRDLQKIRMTLVVLFAPGGEQARPRWDHELKRAWLYKPAQPSQKAGQSPRKTRKRPRQREPSPE